MQKSYPLTAMMTLCVMLVISLVGQVAAQSRNPDNALYNISSLEETYLEGEAQVEELVEVEQPGKAGHRIAVDVAEDFARLETELQEQVVLVAPSLKLAL